MAERMNRGEVVTFEEQLRSSAYEQEAVRRILVRRGILTDSELLEEIKAVRRELESRKSK